MPASYSANADRNLITVEFSGELTDATLRAISTSVRSDPAFSGRWQILVDLQAVTKLYITSEFTQSLARNARSDANRVALVAKTTEQFGFARMYQIVSEGENGRVEVFRTVDQAVHWLARPARVRRRSE